LIGLEAVGLKTLIEKHPKCIGLIFPTQQEANIVGNELKSRLQFTDESSEINSPVMNMFLDYIDVIEKRKEGIYLFKNTLPLQTIRITILTTGTLRHGWVIITAP
jgi:hypothetical protein